MTYEEFKKSALEKKNENKPNVSKEYLDFKNKALGLNQSETNTEANTDALKNLMNAKTTYSMDAKGNLVKTPNIEEAQGNSKKKTALELLQETQNIGAGDTTYIPPDATEKYALKEIEEKETKVAQKYDAITPVANYIAGDLATDVNEAYAEYSNNPTELNKKKVERTEKIYNDYMTNAKNVGKGGWITKDFANYLPQSVEQLKAGLTGGFIGGVTTSAVGSLVPGAGNIIGFSGGAKAGYTAGVAKYSYDQMQGAMYKALIDLGREYNVDITHEMALEISTDTALLQAFVEAGETILDFSGIGKLFTKGGAKTAKALTRKQIIAKALKAYGINLVTETLEEATQEKIAIEGEKKALEQVGIYNPYTKEQEKERIKEAGLGGLKIATIAGLGNLGGTVVVSAINNKNIGEINRAYDTAISEINANEKLSTEEKQAQIATLTNERIQVLQKVKGEIDKNAENRTQISDKNAGNRKEISDVKTDEKMQGVKTSDEISQRLGFKNYQDFKNKQAESRKQTTDSKGRTLTVEQLTHFKDSKMRDENGNLKVMYHGTSADFNEFDITKAKSSGTLGKGFYFTDSVSHAGQYGKQLEVYLNIKNPVQGDYTITEAQLKKYVKAVAENEDYGIENYGYDATVDSVVQSLKGKSDFEILRDINASSIGDFVEAVKFFNEVNGTNYDGIITNTETVVFDSSQVKRVDNAKPTNSKDMRYDSIPTKKKVDIKKEKEYNSREVSRKKGYKEGEIHASFNFSTAEKEQIRSEVWNYRKKEADGLHFIDLSRDGFVSYIYKKQGDNIIPVVRLNGHEEVLNFVRRRVENGSYQEYGTARRWSSIIRDEYRDNNSSISDLQHRGKENRNDAVDGRPNRREQKDDGRRSNRKSEKNLTKNSEKGSNFLPKERYDAMPDVYYMKYPNGDEVEIIRNPTEKQKDEMRKEARTKYAPSYLKEVRDEPLLRRTYDSVGNVYYWQSIDAVHSTIEEFLQSKYPNYKFHQDQQRVYDVKGKSNNVVMPMTAEEKLEKYEEERTQALKKIAEKAGFGFSYFDANKGETQREMFWFLRHSENLRNQFAQENNIVLDGKTSSEKYDLIDGNPKFEKFINKITDEYFKGNRPELTDEEVMEIAQDIHGTTDDYSVGAYMTIDGQLLDFGDEGYRDDHRTISVPTYTMTDFMNAGNIRMQPEGNGFEVIAEPTDAQYDRLADYIDNYLDGEVYVDVSNEKGVSIAGKEYSKGTPSTKILNDLREYFRTGKFPKKSELDDFRYDMMPETVVDSQNRKLSKGQQEYFKDSKMRDGNGNLKVMYHGTKDNFNIFEHNYKKNDYGFWGKGFYFTSDINVAKDYADWKKGNNGTEPKVMEVYLDIKNPLIVDKVETSAKHTIKNILGVDIDTDGYATITQEESNKITQELIKRGYDGIIYTHPQGQTTEAMVLNSNQIKNVDNLNPTDSDDTRYDLMPTMKDGFYSQLENVIINKMQKQAKAKDIMNLIQKNGVKQDEIAWTGVDDFLASRDTVTKEELLQYIRASQLEIEEIIKDDYEKERYEQREAEIRERRQEIEEEIYSILEKYEVHIRYGSPTDVIWEFLYTHDATEIYDLVDLENFDNREENKYYYDAESNGYFTLEEMHHDIDRALELYYEYDDLMQELEAIPETAYGYASDFESSSQYKQYATDWSGGERYREVLYKVPYNTYTKALTPYDSPHWNERNVIAHVRLQDYEDVGGAKVLFIEEIQSDMHQQGRKYGYAGKIEDLDDKINDLKDEAQHLEDTLVIEQRKEQRRLSRRLEEMRYQEEQIIAKHFIRWREYNDEIVIPLEKRTEPESHSVGVSKTVTIDTKYLLDEDIQTTRESMGLSQEELERLIFLHNKQFEDSKKYKNTLLEIEEIEKNNKELQDLYEQIETLQEEKRNNHRKIDSKFPFKTKWHEFVIRKAINEAVQNGYDKVAWTTGEQQAERYDLSKQIDEIKYYQDEKETFFVNVFKDGRSIQSFDNQTADDLENLLGKSIAEKMLKNEGEVEVTKSRFSDASREWHSLSGLDLQVGGEGMKGFYDKIVPDYVNKYIKKWNSKVEEVRIPDYGGEVHVQQGFTITPEMRKSVQEIGQPLYDKEPSIDTMSRKNIIDKFRTVFGVENFANTNKELNSIASDIRNKIKSQKITTTDIKNIVEELGERLQVTTDKYNGEFDDLKDELRSTKIYVSENAKKGFAHWNDFRKNNFGSLRLTNDTKSIKISELYEDLQQRYGTDMFPDDIINESDQLEQIADIAQNLKKENISIEEYSRKMYGPKGWQEIQQMMIDEIKAIRDEYDLENPIDTSKRARVASKETKEILNALNISDEEIYDPANAFVQNILESMEKDKEYFSRTLKEIEEENLMFGNKRVNTILNKRRYDVQSGRVKANPKYTEGASLSSIRKTIEAHTGKKIGLNGFRQRAYGIYKPTLDTIRVKDISNVETAIHELGHRINYVELEQSLKGASRTELNKLAERAFGPMYDDKPDVKLEEGWAEFTKRFICDNEVTIKEYPQLSAYMVEQLGGNKNMKAVVEKLIELSEQYVNAPTKKQIRKMQSVGQDTDSSEKRTFFGQYMYEVHDDLYDLKRMMKVFAKAMGVKYWDVTPELNIYNLARIARSNEDRVLNIMQHGLIDDKGNRRTEGLGDLSELLGNNPEKIQQVRDLLIAMRTLDYTAVGLDTGMSTAEAMSLIKEYSQDKTIMRVANGIITFQDEVMKYAVEKGLMTQEQYEEMKKWNRFYIPLKRVFEGKVNSSSGGTGASKLTKRRTGSMRDIIDPFEAIVQNTSMILDKINQNEIMRALALLQEKTGIADFYEKIDPPQKLKAEVELNLFKNFLEEQGIDTDEIDLDVVQKIFAPMMNDESKMIMGYMEKGKLQALEFKDRFVYEAISQTGGSADLGVILEKALSVSQLLRLGATSGNLEFAVPNMISDTMTAWMFSESGFVPMVDTLKGLADYSLANYGWADNLTKDSKYKQQNKFLYDLYKQSGATMATRVSSYRPEIQEYVLEIFGKHANDLLSADVEKQKNAGKEIIKKLSRGLGKTQDILSILPELSEQATRFEHFKKDYIYARKQGHNHKNALLKATINTRDITMDFNRMGHTMRIYNRIRAFSGARSQGIYRFIEAVNKMPKKVLGKLGILAGVAIALKAGAGASGNKKEEEITDQVRKDNFIIPLGKDGEIVTIKKPQGTARSVINFVELLYDIGLGNIDEKDYNKAWLNWIRDTIEENAPLELDLREGNDFFSTVANMALPTAIEPIIENALNKDFYYGNPIIPYGKEGLRPEDQYDENTSQTAILLGKVLGQSPAKIENLITGWMAGVGQQTLDLSDAILGKVSKDIPDQPSRELNSKTVLRRFFANSFKNSDSVSEVYEQIEKIEQLEEYGEASEVELETLEKLNSAKSTMSDLNKEIKRVRNSLTLTSDQKRDRIKELQILRTDVARNALGKELINPESKEQVELYEYYPSKTTFKYEVHANKTVEVEYTEDDMREYARIVKDTYETALAKEQKKRTYKEMTPEEQKKKRMTLLTSAKSTAQEKISREVYRRSR